LRLPQYDLEAIQALLNLAEYGSLGDRTSFSLCSALFMCYATSSVVEAADTIEKVRMPERRKWSSYSGPLTEQ
jgi:hypothetical protein